MKIVNIEEKNLYKFWTSWEISMKFSGKTYDNNKKSQKARAFAWKTHTWKNRRGVKLTPLSLSRVKDI